MPVRFLSLSAAADRAVSRKVDMYFARAKRDGLITVEHTTDAPEDNGVEKLRNADVLLVFLTPALLISSAWQGALMQDASAAREAGQLITIPILLEHCDHRGTWLGQLMALPRSGAPISAARDEGSVWMAIAEELSALAKRLPPRSKPAASADTGAPRAAVSPATTPEAATLKDAAAIVASAVRPLPKGPIDAGVLRDAYTYIHHHHARLLRLIDETQRAFAREIPVPPEASFDPYVLRHPQSATDVIDGGGFDRVPLENASFTWTSSSAKRGMQRLVVVHEGNGLVRRAADYPEPTSTLSAYLTTAWHPAPSDMDLTWSRVDEWIRKSPGYRASLWETGALHAHAVHPVKIRFGGIVRPVESIDFEAPEESWLEPLLFLVREAIGAMRPG